jgi:hypothetical protein
MDKSLTISKAGKLRLISSVALLGLLLFGGNAAAQCSETFSWLPNSEPDVTGYKIYYGQSQGGPYPDWVVVGNPAPVDGRIHATVEGLVCDQAYYMVCVAINEGDVESAYSNEEILAPGPPINAAIE